MIPFQCGLGSARKVNRWPTIGWKSFFISHSSISAPCVRARQTFEAGWDNLRSMTRERLEAAGLFITGPSGRVGFRDDRGDRSRRWRRISSSQSAEPTPGAVRCSASLAPRGGRAPTPPGALLVDDDPGAVQCRRIIELSVEESI